MKTSGHGVKRKGFNQKATDGVIRVYRETLDLVTQESQGYNADAATETAQVHTQEVQSMYPPGKVTPELDRRLNQPANMPMEVPTDQLEFPFYLSKEQKAILYVPAAMSQREYELLKKQIENSLVVMEATAVMANEELKPQQSYPRSAIWRNQDHDQPVKVIADAGEQDGRRYKKIEGSDTAIPEDELTYQS